MSKRTRAEIRGVVMATLKYDLAVPPEALALIEAVLDGAEIEYSGTGSDFDPHWTVYKPSLPATPTEPCADVHPVVNEGAEVNKPCAECGGSKWMSSEWDDEVPVPCPTCQGSGKREEG